MKKPNYYNKIISLLSKLKKEHPTYNLARHLDTTLFSYQSFWSLSDEEFYHLLEDYKAQLDMNTHSDQDLDDIINQAGDLSSILDEDDLY